MKGIEVEGAPGRCPFCREPVERDQPSAVCRDCWAPQHADCVSENGGACASCGGSNLMFSGSAAADAPVSPDLLARELSGLTVRWEGDEEVVLELSLVPPRQRITTGLLTVVAFLFLVLPGLYLLSWLWAFGWATQRLRLTRDEVLFERPGWSWDGSRFELRCKREELRQELQGRPDLCSLWVGTEDGSQRPFLNSVGAGAVQDPALVQRVHHWLRAWQQQPLRRSRLTAPGPLGKDEQALGGVPPDDGGDRGREDEREDPEARSGRVGLRPGVTDS